MGIRVRGGLMAAVLCAVAAVSPGVAAGAGGPVWEPRGQAVDGAANSVDAPTLKAGSSYTDSIGKGATKAYGVDLDGVSSAYLSAFALPEPGLAVSYGDGIELRLESADGVLCDRYRAEYGSERAARPVGGYTARTAGMEGRCQAAGRYTLLVTRSADGDSGAAAWPLELRYVSEPGLRAGTEPEPAGTYPDRTPTPVKGTAETAGGGVSFDTAAVLGTGVWKAQVAAGATRFYKVRLDWGQRADFIAEFAGSAERQAGDYISKGLRVESYNPMRGRIQDEAKAYRGLPESLVTATVPVAYGNRFSRDDQTAAVRIDGWYYFAVTVDPKAAASAEGGVVPATFRISVGGTAAAGPPYADGTLSGIGRGTGSAVSGSGADAVVGANANANASAGAGGEPDPVLRAVGFGGLGTGSVLVLWLGVWAVAARRRAV